MNDIQGNSCRDFRYRGYTDLEALVNLVFCWPSIPEIVFEQATVTKKKFQTVYKLPSPVLVLQSGYIDASEGWSFGYSVR